jgi:cytochrome b6-f complex iron-sulfur subunit
MLSEAKIRKTPEDPRDKNPEFPRARRRVLQGILGLLGAIGLGHIFYGLSRFWAPGAAGQASAEVALSQIPEGGTVQFLYGGTPGILFRAEDGTFKAFSLICTHLACVVSWNPEKREFYCPCHEGFFDAEGRVTGGPPPAPLERLRVEVSGEKVVVGG